MDQLTRCKMNKLTATELIYILEHSGSETPEESRAKKQSIEAINTLQLIADMGTVFDNQIRTDWDGLWCADQAKAVFK